MSQNFGSKSGDFVSTFYSTTSTDHIFVEAQAYSESEIGGYEIRVNIADDYSADKSTNGRISGNGKKFGAIETSGDVDWITLFVARGRTYTINLTGIGTDRINDTRLKVIDSNGNVVAEDSGTGDRFSQLTFTSTELDIHQIVVEGNSTATGTYRLTSSVQDDFTDDSSTLGFLDLTSGSTNVAIEGDIESPGDKDWIRVKLRRGQWYEISTTSLQDELPQLEGQSVELFDTNGTSLLSFSGLMHNARGKFYAPKNGRYFVEVKARSGWRDGKYELTVRETKSEIAPIEKVVAIGIVKRFDVFEHTLQRADSKST